MQDPRQPLHTISIIGCGWLGKPLAERLLQEGYQVKGSTTSAEKIPDLRRSGIEAHLLNVKEKAIEGSVGELLNTDLLILNIPPGRRRPDVAERYPRQIRLLIEAARMHQLSRLIFVSSTGVYPDTDDIVTEEDTRLTTTGSGAALIACERYLRSLPDLEVSILRLGGLVGGQRKAGRFLAGKKNVSNGDAPVNMLHRKDAIGVIQTVISQRAWGETFNVCADEHPSRQDFYIAQAEKQGYEPPTFSPKGNTSYKIVSNQKVKEILGYTFQYPDPMDF